MTITSGSSQIYSGTAAGLSAQVDLLARLGITSVAAGQSIPFTFVVTLDASATSAYAGKQVSQPLAWTFTA